jgi:hypothetical protein
VSKFRVNVKNYTYPIALYIYIYILTLTQGQCKYLSNTLKQPCVNVLGHVNINTKFIGKVTLSLSLVSPPNPFFSGIHKVTKFYQMKSWKSAFNAQGSRLIIYAATLEALKKKQRQVETQFTTKTEVPPPPPYPWMLMFFFFWGRFLFFEFHPLYDQTQGFSVIFLTLKIILLYTFNDHTFLQSHMN